MKKLTIFLFLISSINLAAQFSISVELKYLETINNSADKMLHRQNFHNVELVCDSLFLNNDNPLGGKFLSQSAESYLKGENYAMAVFSIIRQRCIFPCDSLEAAGIEILRKATTHLGFSFEKANKIIKSTNTASYNKPQLARRKAIITAFNTGIKELDKVILHHIELYRYKYPKSNDAVLNQIFHLLEIEMPVKYRISSISREAGNTKDWLGSMPHKNLMVLLRKEVRYYRKNGSKKKAKAKLKEYKAHKKGLGQSLFYLWKSVCYIGV